MRKKGLQSLHRIRFQQRKNGVALHEASEIIVELPEYIIPAVSKTSPPITSNDARFHIQYILLLAINGEDIITPEHSLDFAHHWMDSNIQRN